MKLREAAQGILDEMEDRYDGAPDSTTLWMGNHMRELEGAIKTHTDVDEFLERGMRITREALLEAGITPVDSIWFDRCARGGSVISKMELFWRVSVVIMNTRDYIFSGQAQDMEDAVRDLVVNIKSKATCSICGGHMEGPCKHSHEGKLT